MKALERRIQRDYPYMPKSLRDFFIFESKWFGVITHCLGCLALITMWWWCWSAVNQTWLVGGDKLITENINTLPHVFVVIVGSVGIVLIPSVFSAIARYYYVSNRNEFNRN